MTLQIDPLLLVNLDRLDGYLASRPAVRDNLPVQAIDGIGGGAVERGAACLAGQRSTSHLAAATAGTAAAERFQQWREVVRLAPRA